MIDPAVLEILEIWAALLVIFIALIMLSVAIVYMLTLIRFNRETKKHKRKPCPDWADPELWYNDD